MDSFWVELQKLIDKKVFKKIKVNGHAHYGKAHGTEMAMASSR